MIGLVPDRPPRFTTSPLEGCNEPQRRLQGWRSPREFARRTAGAGDRPGDDSCLARRRWNPLPTCRRIVHRRAPSLVGRDRDVADSRQFTANGNDRGRVAGMDPLSLLFGLLGFVAGGGLAWLILRRTAPRVAVESPVPR